MNQIKVNNLSERQTNRLFLPIEKLKQPIISTAQDERYFSFDYENENDEGNELMKRTPQIQQESLDDSLLE